MQLESLDRPPRLAKANVALVPAAILGFLTIFGFLAIVGPFGTNDGPVHIAFASLHHHGPEGVQSEIYARNETVILGQLIYRMAGPFVSSFGADGAEAMVQAVVLALVPLATAAAVSVLGGNGLLAAVLALPLALNQTFFFGLYGFCLSFGLAILCLAVVADAGARTPARWLVCSILLVLAGLAHPGGLILGLILVAAAVVPRFLGQAHPGERLQLAAFVVLAILPSAALVLWHVALSQPSAMGFGPAPLDRIKHMLKFSLLSPNHGFSRIPVIALGVCLLAVVIVGVIRRIPSCLVPDVRHLQMFLLLVLTGLNSLFFPDVLGGGWTHARRMYLGFYLSLIVVACVYARNRSSERIILTIGLLAFLGTAGETLHRQWHVTHLRAEADQMLTLVTENATLLPLLPKQAAAALPFSMDYRPLFHVANRLEATGNHAVLHNFLAPLSVYSIGYRSRSHPMSLLFSRDAESTNPNIESVDIAGFERVSGITVDFLLSLGPIEELPVRLRPVGVDFKLAATSSGNLFFLYSRRRDEEGHGYVRRTASDAGAGNVL